MGCQGVCRKSRIPRQSLRQATMKICYSFATIIFPTPAGTASSGARRMTVQAVRLERPVALWTGAM